MEAEQSQAREGQVQVAAQERAGGGEPGSLRSPLSLPFSFSPFFSPLLPPSHLNSFFFLLFFFLTPHPPQKGMLGLFHQCGMSV